MFKELPYISVLPFFEISCFCYYVSLKKKIKNKDKEYLLPDFTKYNEEESFSDIYIGWNEAELRLFINVNSPVINTSYPDYRKGDSIEIFIDTRDRKNKGFLTRFCHHFVFFPQKIGGLYGKEITRFRGEDIHKICDPKDLTIECEISSSSYTMEIALPKECLYGYEPDRWNKFGFTYRINRAEKQPQHFSLISDEYLIEQNPSLWSSIEIKKGKDL
jgi:hypothetical protein